MYSPSISAQHPLILYDGDCPLCQSSVRFVLKADREGRIRFSPQGSSLGKRILSEWFPSGQVPDSLVFADQGRLYVRSEAAFAILNYLPMPWKALLVFKILPRFLLDLAYRVVAGLRKTVGRGKRTCELPSERFRNRFLV